MCNTPVSLWDLPGLWTGSWIMDSCLSTECVYTKKYPEKVVISAPNTVTVFFLQVFHWSNSRIRNGMIPQQAQCVNGDATRLSHFIPFFAPHICVYLDNFQDHRKMIHEFWHWERKWTKWLPTIQNRWCDDVEMKPKSPEFLREILGTGRIHNNVDGYSYTFMHVYIDGCVRINRYKYTVYIQLHTYIVASILTYKYILWNVY